MWAALTAIYATLPAVTAQDGSIDGVTSIVSDLGPLAQLVGEKTVKQFLGSVSTWEYYPLLAFAPVGVVTIIVTALRVARVPWMMGSLDVLKKPSLT